MGEYVRGGGHGLEAPCGAHNCYLVVGLVGEVGRGRQVFMILLPGGGCGCGGWGRWWWWSGYCYLVVVVVMILLSGGGGGGHNIVIWWWRWS